MVQVSTIHKTRHVMTSWFCDLNLQNVVLWQAKPPSKDSVPTFSSDPRSLEVFLNFEQREITFTSWANHNDIQHKIEHIREGKQNGNWSSGVLQDTIIWVSLTQHSQFPTNSSVLSFNKKKLSRTIFCEYNKEQRNSCLRQFNVKSKQMVRPIWTTARQVLKQINIFSSSKLVFLTSLDIT